VGGLWCKTLSRWIPNDKIYKVTDQVKVRVNLYCRPFEEVVTVNGVPVLKPMHMYMYAHKMHGNKWLDKLFSNAYTLSAPVTLNFYEQLENNSELSYLLAAINKFDDLKLYLKNKCTAATVFAPNNDAFKAIAAEYNVTVENLIKNMVTKEILKDHLLSNVFFSAAFKAGKAADINNLNNEKLKVFKSVEHPGSLFVSSKETKNAKVLDADVLATNGVIHIIDKILL
jgi:uncharacterized surface protein with fasciclin (FAS1) repeats